MIPLLKKKCKGVSRGVTKKVSHDIYVDCLFNRVVTNATMPTIRSYDHVLKTQLITKRFLSPYDDKRYILDDGITSYSYGHYKITH